MKINSKSVFLLGFLGLIIYLYSQFLYKNSSGQSGGIILSALAKPKSSLPRCYPSEIDGPPLEQYSVQRRGAKYTYYIASQLNDKSQSPSTDVVLIKERFDGRCQILNKTSQLVSLLAFVPQDIAVNLAKQQLNKIISKIGLKTYQARLNNIQVSEDPNPYFYFPEQVMALKELGLKIPKNIVIVNQVCESELLNPYTQKQMKKDKIYAENMKADCPPLKKYNE